MINLEGNDEIKFYRARGKYGFLSNLYKKPIIFEGREFPTSEHAYQFGKFKDPEAREWAMLTPKPHLLAGLAHSLLSFDIVEGWTDGIWGIGKKGKGKNMLGKLLMKVREELRNKK